LSPALFYRFLVACAQRPDFLLRSLNLALISMNLVLMRWYGVAGIALATSSDREHLYFSLYWTWNCFSRLRECA